MFWETLAAILLIATSFPIWLFLSVIWGIVRGALAGTHALLSLLSDTPADWGEVWVVPAAAAFQGVASAWSIPSAIWTWAKFDHPVWAAVIAVLLMGVNGSRRA
ncbi:hypothetical protein LVO79_16715 [Roseivivax marinus]|uniref:hypothetical protein n=1 Tax=Roseivivax marinus TaxID=1379903 RepID=UPI001F04CA8F|nr:hypothetical protein [Roseivivax marinus]UMA64621.1 hypothetical protein LVO79_16715 [Roseivivax marinus]